jgi:methylaspartate mutase sigma subunit
MKSYICGKIYFRGGIVMEEKTVILGVIGSDVHAVGNRILEEALTEAGFDVVNIGVLSTQEDFINAAVETDADAILVSSLYGHGEMDCKGFKDKCIEAGLDDVLIYIGGNLVVGKQDWQPTKQKFLEMGFDRVYPPGTEPEEAIADLKDDLG